MNIEKSLIGCLLRKPSLIYDSRVRPHHFSNKAHRGLFEAISEHIYDQDDIDLGLVADMALERFKISFDKLKEDYMFSCATKNFSKYEDSLIEAYMKTRLYEINSSISDGILSGDPPEKIISLALSGLDSFYEDADKRDYHVGAMTKEFMEGIYSSTEHKGLSGVSTGIPKLSSLTGGWQKSDLIILGARPGMGKTTFSLNQLLASAESGVPSAIYSLEMSSEQLIMCLVEIKTGISTQYMRTGSLNTQEIREIESAVGYINNLPIFIYDDKITCEEIVNSIKFSVRKYGVGFVVIDYLQLMSSQKGNFQNKTGEVEYMSRMLKMTAHKANCNIPIMCLSQLSRYLERRENKRPMMSDLRESGAIEQDADMVLFLYREGYYVDVSSEDDFTELLIPKHRMGDTGMIKLTFKNRKYE